MRKLSHICMGISVLSLIMLLGTRYILGGWQNFLFVPLISFLLFLVIGIAINSKEYLRFFTMKTTKEGLNTGTLIVFFILFLGLINYFAIQTNKNFDLTQEKLFTLSPQTIEAVKALDGGAKIFVFHQGPVPEEAKRGSIALFKLMKEHNKELQYQFLDAFENPELAAKYIQREDVQNSKVFVYVEHGDKVVHVDHPMNEEQYTQAIIKVTRTKSRQVYFTQGHKEWDLMAIESEPFGLGRLRKTLEDYSFNISSLDLIANPRVPNDAAVVVILGPKGFFAKEELDALIEYATNGGKFLIALDPGIPNNLGELLAVLGVEFKNNFINDPTSAMGQMTIIAKQYSPSHPITKDFGDRMTLLNLTSEVTLLSKGEGSSEELLFSSPSSMALKELKPPTSDVERRPYSIVVALKSKVKDSDKEFAAVVFGDSDIFRSELLYVFSNRDLVINSMAFLTEENDLISIRPKQASVTEVVVTRMNNMFLVVLVVLIPIVLFAVSFFIWLRRRSGE